MSYDWILVADTSTSCSRWVMTLKCKIKSVFTPSPKQGDTIYMIPVSWYVWYLRVIPVNLIGTAEITHHVVEARVTSFRVPIDLEHTPKYWRDFCSLTAWHITIPCAVRQVVFRGCIPVITWNIEIKNNKNTKIQFSNDFVLCKTSYLILFTLS